MKKIISILLVSSLLYSCKKDSTETTTPQDDNILPIVVTEVPSPASQSITFCAGHITSEGKDHITARGMCWGKMPNPSLANWHSNEGAMNAGFASELYGLSASTTYYVRAYASNSYGTSYGSQFSFTTSPITTVTFGTQQWFTEDVNVTTYRNGDEIPQVQDIFQWSTLTTGAWCFYSPTGNETDNFHIKLYNWYAVNDARGFLPVGYHVPTDAEWTTLTTYLGGTSVAGGKLKAMSGWAFPNTGATPGNMFNAYPSGFLYANGIYSSIEIQGSWWTSTQSNSTDAWYRAAYASTASVARYSASKRTGYAVRGIKD